MSLVKNINYQKKRFSLQIDEMEIPNQGLTLLSGESGSGKSTLIDLLIGFKTAKDMSWLVDGEDYCQLPIKNKKIGLVLQGGVLFPHLSVLDIIHFAGRSRGRDNESISKEMGEYIDELNLPQKILSQKGSQLSGGERQRIAFLCALIGQPKILLLDEPFSALDSNNKKKASSLLDKYLLSHQIPALLVTHDLNPDFQVGARFNLQDGRLQN